MSRQHIDNLVSIYFKLGLNNKEILSFLAENHHIVVSERTLKRVTARCGLFRRKQYSDILEVSLFIQKQCSGSSHLHGYRWMHRKCLEEGFVVSRETVRILRSVLDPEGVASRGNRRLHRRLYNCSGPNAMWHIDGYDKLKPFGICIHGCIDGFSRYVVWMEAWSTNNDPKIVAGYFIDAVKNANGCPERLRSDAGTENRHVEQIQYFLRENHTDKYSGTKSFLYGRSTGNQRIESWWGILRKQCIQYWMDLFKQLQYDGFYCGDFLDKNLIQFCFMEAIQTEINDVVQTWNFHRIRASKKDLNPKGKPAVLYCLPRVYGTEDKLKPVDPRATDICEGDCIRKSDIPCNVIIYELCTLLMGDFQWNFPEDRCQLCDLYLALRREIRTEL